MKRNRSMEKSFVKIGDELIQEGTLLGFKGGQTLFYQGHLPYGVFVIASGWVDLVFEEKNGLRETFRAPLNTPIGIDLLYDSFPYPFTAIAREPVVAFFIEKNSLMRILKPEASRPASVAHEA